jgi:tetratricopeptide (TPR) repeat protein
VAPSLRAIHDSTLADAGVEFRARYLALNRESVFGRARRIKPIFLIQVRTEARVADSREAIFREAQRLQGRNQVGEAIAAYQRALLQWPEHANSWFNLGLLFRQARLPDEALVCYQKALNLGITSPEEVHLNRAVVYADFLRQDAQAERELRSALAANSNYIPALLNLANLHEDRGERDEALELYQRIVQLDPQNTLALARFANMQKPAECTPGLIAQLRSALARPLLSDEERAVLGFALGRALDASGAYQQAFEAYTAANATTRAAAARALPRYDRHAQEQFVDRLIQASGSAPAASVAARAGPAPIFICGMFRSGSTLAEQLLARHPGVAAGGELDLLPSLVARELTPFPESLTSKSAADLQALAKRYQDSVASLFPDATHVTDKRPANFLYIGLIKALFPDAKIIHTTREPLDNCVAIYFLHLEPEVSYATDLLDIGHYYREYRRLMAHWQQRYGADIIELNYDRFVSDPEAVAAPVFSALGLRWDQQFLERSSSGQTVKTASVWQVREPLYLRSSGRSRHYTEQLGALRSYLAELPRP